MQDVRGGEIALIFQEPMTALNPVFTIGNQIEETLLVHGARDATHRASARPRAARGGQHPGPGAAHPRIPAPAVRRPAPARADRHFARLQPVAGHRRRADHRARRDDPGADPRSAARAARADGPVAAAHHPRPRGCGGNGRSCRRHVCRAGSSKRRRSSAVRRPETSIHARPDGVDPGRRPGTRLRAIQGTVPPLGELPPGCAFAPRCPERFEPCTAAPPGDTVMDGDRRVKCFCTASVQRFVQVHGFMRWVQVAVRFRSRRARHLVTAVRTLDR